MPRIPGRQWVVCFRIQVVDVRSLTLTWDLLEELLAPHVSQTWKAWPGHYSRGCGGLLHAPLRRLHALAACGCSPCKRNVM